MGIQNCSYREGCPRLRGGSLAMTDYLFLPSVQPVEEIQQEAFLPHSLSNGWVSWNPIHRNSNGKLHPHRMLLMPLTCAMCVCVLRRFSLTLCDPMDCSPPGFSVHGILQARVLEWVATPFSRGSSPPRDQASVSCGSCIAGRFLTTEPPGKPNAFII